MTSYNREENILVSFKQSFHRVITYLETADIPFANFVLTFFAATTLRNLLEQLVFADSAPHHLGSDLFHYYLSYIALALGFIILLKTATKESAGRVSRVVLPFFIILNIVPPLDMIFFSQGRYSLGYMFPGEHDPLGQRFLTFFGSLGESGITFGMRLEIVLVILACAFYFAAKGLGWVRNLLFCLLVYTVSSLIARCRTA